MQNIIVGELVGGRIISLAWTGSKGKEGEKEFQEKIHMHPIENIPRDLPSPVRL